MAPSDPGDLFAAAAFGWIVTTIFGMLAIPPDDAARTLHSAMLTDATNSLSEFVPGSASPECGWEDE